MAVLLIVGRAVAGVAAERARERRGGLGAEGEAAQGRVDGLDRPEALCLRVEGLGDLAIGRGLVVRVAGLGVEDLDGVQLADAVAHLAGVHPDGELGRQVLKDVLDRHAALLRGALQHRVDRVAGFQASERRALERLLRVPVALELVLERLLELLAEEVDPSARQFVVEVRYHEVKRHLHLDVHLGLRWENLRAVVVARSGRAGTIPRTSARSAVLPRAGDCSGWWLRRCSRFSGAVGPRDGGSSARLQPSCDLQESRVSGDLQSREEARG